MKLIFLFMSLFSFCTFAASSEFWVLDRKIKSNRTFYRKVVLPDLTSEVSFSGKYFKIVQGISSKPITFDSEDDLVLKAATVYYHLTRARDYWNVFASNRVNQEPITIRLEIINQFDQLGHFAHPNRNPQYNNAVTIPSGRSPDWVPSERADQWEKEIWFRPMKYIESSSLPGPQNNPLEQTIQQLQGPFINYTRNQFNQNLLEHLFYPNYAANPLWLDFIRFAGTIAITKLVFEGSKHADKLFIEKFYYLDTAMVPEITYHEYNHFILSDFLDLTHSTPVTEGMADYFAAVISKRRKISDRVRGFSNALARDRNNRTIYNHWLESNQFSNADFVLALLWDIREVFHEELADKLIFETRKKLKVQTATINHHMLEALIETCHEICPNPRNDKLKLYQIFTKRGL